MPRDAERSDVTPLLDACYAPIRDDQRWASEVVATFREGAAVENGVAGPRVPG